MHYHYSTVYNVFTQLFGNTIDIVTSFQYNSSMKHRFLEYGIAWLLLLVLGMIVLHAPLTVYVGTQWPALELVVKGWKEVLMSLATILLIVEVSRLGKWKLFTQDRLFWIIAAYAALHLLLVAVLPGSSLAEAAGIAIDLRYVLYFALVYGFLRLYPAYAKSFLKVGVIGACIVVGFASMQLFLPRDALRVFGYDSSTIAPYLTVDDNEAYIRHNSTLRGPNPLGAYALIVLTGVVAAGMRFGRTLRDKRIKLLHVFLAVGSVVALWISYSRSALLGVIVAIALLVGISGRVRITKNSVMIAMIIAVMLSVVGYMARDTSFMQNVVMHNNPTTGAATDSNTGHANSLADGMRLAVAQPFGAGVGSTGSASLFTDNSIVIENQYLLIAHETGWLGLGLFLAIMTNILMKLWRQRNDWMAKALWASGIGLAVIGLLLPVWADDTVSVVWWGLAAVVIAKGSGHGTKTNKKAA
jgi:hypothetical protein